MATQLQHRRGTGAQHGSFTGAAGEITVDTTDNRAVIHDGSTAGGIPAATEAEVMKHASPSITANLDTNGNNIIIDTTKGLIDDSSNEYVVFTKTASAVNHIGITNNATGLSPIIAAAGDDTNIDLSLDAKGTGGVEVGGSYLSIDYGANGPGELRIREDSDNGTNYMGFKAPASVTSSLALELPDGDGTANQVLETNASGVLSWATKMANLSDDTSATLGSDLDTNSFNIGFDTDHGINDANGNEMLYFTTTASAVNYANVTNSATGNDVVIAAKGDDTNIGLTINSKGTGDVTIGGSVDNSFACTVENSSATTPFGMRILLSGASPDDNNRYFLNCQDSTTIRCKIFSDGDIQNHDNSYGALSDRRVKQDIVDASSQINDVKRMRVRKYRMISDVEAYGDNAKTHIGLVAQELEAAGMGGLVKTDENGQKSVTYSLVNMKLVKALQEEITLREELEVRVAKLEGAR